MIFTIFLKQLRQFIKDFEKKILNDFLEAFQLLEGKLKILKKIPFVSFQSEISSWKLLAKEKLMTLSEKTEKNQMHFDILENKENPEKDIIKVGQGILIQSKKISTLPLNLIKAAIDNIDVFFNEQTIYKNIEEVFCDRNLKLSPELKNVSLSAEDIRSLENYFNKTKVIQQSPNNYNNWGNSLSNDEVFKSKQSINIINERLEGKRSGVSIQEEKSKPDFQITNSFINSLNFQELIKESNPKLDDSEFLLSGDISDFSAKLIQNPPNNSLSKTKPPLKNNNNEDKSKMLQTIEEKSEKGISSSKNIINRPSTYLMVNKRAASKSPFRGNSNVNTSLDKFSENEFRNLISPNKSVSPFISDSPLDISTEKKLSSHTSQKKLGGFLGFRLNEKFLPIFNGLRSDILEVVDFTCADLGDSGISFLAESLGSSLSMKSLKLVKNKITDEGAVTLCKALMQNYSLANLNLTLNQLTDKSIDSFFGLVKVNPTLKNLYLLQNNISVNKFKPKVKEFKTVGTNLFI